MGTALEVLRAGDTLVVWKLDRLGRSLSHLVTIVNDLQHHGIHFQSLQEKIDTTSGTGKLVFLAGLAAARARGRLGGRPTALDTKQATLARALYNAKEPSVKAICTLLGIGKTTFYRYLKQAGTAG